MTLNASIPTIEHALIVVESEIPRGWQDGTLFLSQQCKHRGGMTTHMGLAWVKNRNSVPNKNKTKPKQVQKQVFFYFLIFFFLVVVVDTGFPYYVIMVVQKLSAFFYGNLRLTEFDLPLPPEDWDKRPILHAWILSQILSLILWLPDDSYYLISLK